MAAPVSSSYCAPYETQLVVKKESFPNSRQFTVTDGQGGLRFKMKYEGGFLSSPKRTMFDATSGKLLLSILKEVSFMGKAPYMAFQGVDENHLLFTFKKKTAFLEPTSYEVFLPGNDNSSSPDFFLQKSSRWRKGFSILSQGRILAEAEKTGWGMVYSVKVYAGVDQAFIAALTILWIIEVVKAGSGAAAGAAAAAG